MAPSTSFRYSGSLESSYAFYVTRPADRELHERLAAGDYCFVFNCRQMGKSSLRVRVMKQLKAEGVRCAVIDPQGCSSNITEQEWYAGVIHRLVMDLGLDESFDILPWWQDCEARSIGATQRFSNFIEHVLLVRIEEPIVIFVEEVDWMLRFHFDTDGFFGLVRWFFERRSIQPAYRRLTFCFLGVATPYDLVKDHDRVAFNIGSSVELSGLARPQADPLLEGLKGKVADPEAVLNAVLHWTGGQPFLTQKLLALVSSSGDGEQPAEQLVEAVAANQIIRNWESVDDPLHLRNIRDRLLVTDERQKRDLLSLVRTILLHGGIPSDTSKPEHMQLRLTGLVVSKDQKLCFYNPIYARVFNLEWVQRQLEEIPPPIYAEAIAAWKRCAAEERPNRLINGAALEEAEAWAKQREELSEDDQAFLTQSREAYDASLRIAHEKEEAEKRAKAAERRTKLVIGVGLLAMAGLVTTIYYRIRIPAVAAIKDLEAYCLDENRQLASADIISCGEENIFPTKTGEPVLDDGYQQFRAKDYQNALAQLKKPQYLNDPQAEIAANNAKVLLTKDPQRIYTIAVSLPGDRTRGDIQNNLLRGVAKAQTTFNDSQTRQFNPGNAELFPGLAKLFPGNTRLFLDNAKLFVIMANDSYDPDKGRQIAQDLADQPFLLGLIGTYSSQITFAQLLALKGQQLPYISASSTATKSAFEELANKNNDSLGDLSLFLRSMNTTDTEAEGLAQLIHSHQPKAGKFLFFFQKNDLYTHSYLASFRKSLAKRGISTAEEIDLNQLPENKPEEFIRRTIQRHRNQYSDAKGRQIVAVLINATRADKIRKHVFTMINENKNGDFLLVGANTLVGDDSLTNATIRAYPKARENFLASITYSPNKPGMEQLNRLVGSAYDATAILLTAATRAASKSERVTRSLVANELRSGNLDIDLLGRQFLIRDSERSPKMSYTVSPSCKQDVCHWLEWQKPQPNKQMF
jgi:ABC-type branched-subunit amino acid transport system substrate-binding protein